MGVEESAGSLDRERLALDQEKLELDKRRMRIEVLTSEYKNRFTEVMFHSERYHRQVNIIQLYLTVAVSLVVALSTNAAATMKASLPVRTADTLAAIVVTIAFLLALYLFTNVMDAIYTTYMNGRRLADLERKINRLANSRLLEWDSEIIPRLYSVDKFLDGAWIRPNVLMVVWGFLFFTGVSLGLCAATYVLVRPYFYVFTPVALFLTSVTLLNWRLLHREGMKFIDAAVSQTDPDTDGTSILYLIVLANTFLGYLPMLLLSVRDAAFYGPPHQFPFCSIISVALGDLVLIPLVAYMAISFLRDWTWRELRWPTMASVLLSGAVNAYLNYSWVHDQWTGFMDTQMGRLSAGGYVHLVYSFLVASLCTLFVIILVSAMRRDDPRLSPTSLAIARRGVAALTVFLALGIVDAALTHLRLVGGSTADLASALWPSLLVPASSAVLWILVSRALAASLKEA